MRPYFRLKDMLVDSFRVKRGGVPSRQRSRQSVSFLKKTFKVLEMNVLVSKCMKNEFNMEVWEIETSLVVPSSKMVFRSFFTARKKKREAKQRKKARRTSNLSSTKKKAGRIGQWIRR